MGVGSTERPLCAAKRVWLERHVVFFGRARPRLRSFGRGRGRGTSGGWRGGWATLGSARVQELEALEDHPELALLLMSILVLPLVQLKPAFHKHWPPFFEVLRDDFGLASPSVHINEGHCLLGFAGFVFPRPVDRQADAGDGGAFGCVTQFRVAGQVAREDYFIEVSHDGS